MINTHAGCRLVTLGKAGPGLFLCRVPGRHPLGTAQPAAWCTRAQRAELPPPPGLELRGWLGAAAQGHPALPLVLTEAPPASIHGTIGSFSPGQGPEEMFSRE